MKLHELDTQLRGVNRQVALKALYNELTETLQTNEENTPRFSNLSTQYVRHAVQAIYPNGSAVLDPLLLLELNEYRCGVGARLGLDLLKRAKDFQAELYTWRITDWAKYTTMVAGTFSSPLFLRRRGPTHG